MEARNLAMNNIKNDNQYLEKIPQPIDFQKKSQIFNKTVTLIIPYSNETLNFSAGTRFKYSSKDKEYYYCYYFDNESKKFLIFALKKDLVVCFITTNDITGGNSGSPVIDASGNLLGLAFDGNYEALSHKIAFDKDLNRTICVDVRYILWCIDKLGGASNIIKELKLVK